MTKLKDLTTSAPEPGTATNNPSREVAAMGLVYDNLLGHNVDRTKRDTALYGILYGELIVSDSWMMSNEALQKMISARDGLELIQHEIVRPVRRSIAATFAEVYNQIKAANMYGLCAKPDYLAMLDTPAVTDKTRTYEFPAVRENYIRLSEQVLRPDVLASFGISAASNDLIQKGIQQAKDAGRKWHTNSFVKDYLCPLLSEADADLLMELSRAPYSLNLPSVLDIGIVGPDNFKGDRVLAALKANTKTVGSIDVREQVAGAAFRQNIDNPLVRWLLDDETLTGMSAEELVICRSPAERQTYLEKLQIFLNLPNKEAWDALMTELNLYLSKAAEDLFRHRKRSNRLVLEEEEGGVVVEGANSIRLTRPGDTVVLTGVPGGGGGKANDTVKNAQNTAVRIIGKTFSLPDNLNKAK